MKDFKVLKDPLYGYIHIPIDIVNGIIDSAAFQRLRRVSQTSYAPLYSSAVHNRFVHSIGVYHLGKMVGEQLVKEIRGKEIEDIQKELLERLCYIFTIACLLHDVGHAPFSHTGEEFYLEENQKYDKIHAFLKETVNCDDFTKDIPYISKSAAPHEIMSAIVGIKAFSSILSKGEDKSFFARCITGYKYSEQTTINSIKNCFIQLLNSKVIDVDKLDYLIRDSFITGYESVKIDYVRLLSSVTVVVCNKKIDDKINSEQANATYLCCDLAYNKNAISVIENVIYAHDSERKWIQTHPVILYENYILQHVMKLLTEKLDTEADKLFSYQSLSTEGQTLKDGVTIRLLCDDDIVYLMKKYYDEDPLIKEYFDRKLRRHPVWKSEAEYKALFLTKLSAGDILTNLVESLKVTAEYLSKNTENWVINEELVKRLQAELKDLETLKTDANTLRIQREEKEKILKVVTCLTEYAKSAGYTGDYVLIKADQFNSGFAKPDFSETTIVFPRKGKVETVKFKDVAASLMGIGSISKEFFYLFYERSKDEKQKMDIYEIRKKLIQNSVE